MERFQLGKLYQKYLILEITRHMSFQETLVWLWESSHQARQYLLKFYSAIAQTSTNSGYQLTVKAWDQNDRLQIKYNEKYRDQLLKIQVKKFSEFMNIISEFPNLKIHKLERISENKEDELKHPDEFKCLDIILSKNLIYSLSIKYRHQSDISFPKDFEMTNFKCLKQLQLTSISEKQLEQILSCTPQLVSFTFALDNKQSFSKMKLIPKGIRKLKIENQSKTLFLTDEFFQSLSELNLDKLSLIWIQNNQFAQKCFLYNCFPRRLSVSTGMQFTQEDDFKLLAEFFSKVHLERLKPNKPTFYKPNIIKLEQITHQIDLFKNLLFEFQEIEVSLSNQKSIMVTQNEFDHITQQSQKKSKLKNLTISVEPYTHNNSQTLIMIQFLLNISPNLSKLRLEKIAIDDFLTFEMRSLKFNHVNLSRLRTIELKQCNMFSITVLKKILETNECIRNLTITDLIKIEQYETLLELPFEYLLYLNLGEAQVVSRIEFQTPVFIAKFITPLASITRTLQYFSFNTQLYLKKETADAFLDIVLSNCTQLKKLGIYYNFLMSKLWQTDQINRKLVQVINSKLQQITTITLCDYISPSFDNMIEIFKSFKSLNKKLKIIIENTITESQYLKVIKDLSTQKLEFLRILK